MLVALVCVLLTLQFTPVSAADCARGGGANNATATRSAAKTRRGADAPRLCRNVSTMIMRLLFLLSAPGAVRALAQASGAAGVTATTERRRTVQVSAASSPAA